MASHRAANLRVWMGLAAFTLGCAGFGIPLLPATTASGGAPHGAPQLRPLWLALLAAGLALLGWERWRS